MTTTQAPAQAAAQPQAQQAAPAAPQAQQATGFTWTAQTPPKDGELMVVSPDGSHSIIPATFVQPKWSKTWVKAAVAFGGALLGGGAGYYLGTRGSKAATQAAFDAGFAEAKSPMTDMGSAT